MFGFFKRRRRQKTKSRGFPADWIEILNSNIPLYRYFSQEDQKELQGHIQVLVAEKNFEGLAGLEMTDEIKVTIAAQAAVLLLHRETDYYPSLMSILVYPYEYVVRTTRRLPDGTIAEGDEARLGEFWTKGAIVLSWDDVQKGAADIRDGSNVVFHEFAHQLDSESGGVQGVPALECSSCYAAWARIFVREYEHLIHDIEHHRKTVIRQYGATNHAEFFAVVTEAFFEKPLQLKKSHPELYEQMVGYFKQDPALLFSGKQS